VLHGDVSFRQAVSNAGEFLLGTRLSRRFTEKGTEKVALAS
jgi:hypothetical protein